MHLKDIFSPSTIISDSLATDKGALLVEIAGKLSVPTGISQSLIADVLIARESLQSTGVGDGIAIPHGKIAGIDSIVGAIARCPRGLNFDSIDGEKVRLFFALLAPEDLPTEHLKVLARVSRMLKNSAIREAILTADGSDEIYRIVSDFADAE